MDKNIFIIDDDPYVLHLLSLTLQGPGRRIISASTAYQAEELFRIKPPDFIFLDIVLPDADGRRYLQELRTRPFLAAVPIIMLTSRIEADVRQECLALGATDYIQKPFDNKEVTSLILEHLSITVPVKPPAPVKKEPGSSPKAKKKLGDIILAEDDEMIAALVKHRLARDGFTIHHYGDGAAAYEGAQEHKASMFILDVKMPEMDGFELLERLRLLPEYMHTPVIMLTVMGQEKDIVRGLELGANDYICKPFSPSELVARVHRHLR